MKRIVTVENYDVPLLILYGKGKFCMIKMEMFRSINGLSVYNV